MTFRVGQKVVCIRASGIRVCAPLTDGEIYTVAGHFIGVGPDESGNIESGLALLLVGLENPRTETGGLNGYCARRFRPAVDIKTDITIFRKIDADVFGKVSA